MLPQPMVWCSLAFGLVGLYLFFLLWFPFTPSYAILTASFGDSIPRPKSPRSSKGYQGSSHISREELDRIAQACQELKAKKLIRTDKRENKLVDWDKKFAYSIIQKSASSSIMQILAWWNPLYTRRRIKARLIPNDTVIKRINDFNLFRFTFVRHPLERLYSAFQDKIVNRAHKNIMNRSFILKHYGPSFENFSTYVVKELFMKSNGTFDRFNCHFKPQFILGEFCLENYHFIGRVEHFQRDMRLVLGLLGYPEKYIEAHLNLRLNPSSNKPNTSMAYKQLPKHLLVALRKIYHLDFWVFDYH